MTNGTPIPDAAASVTEIGFGRCIVRLALRDVLVDGKAFRPGARAFDLLVALVDRRERVVTKQELLDIVWPGMIVEENNLQVHISALRKLLGPQAIATIPGRGYRFTLLPGAAPQAAAPSPARSGEVAHQILEAQNADHGPLTAAATPNNLPRQLSSFIGRDAEIAAVEALLARTRLLTLIGSGGCGKTRLSLQVAANAVRQFPDGVWFVELAALTDSSLLPQAVASALGVKEEPGTPLTHSLVEHLKSKRVLLVIDNCEHLLDACASIVETLLQQCAGLSLLASSRQALAMAGEQTYRVPSLTLPERYAVLTPEQLRRYESIRLFVDRAKLARADFELTAENAGALASLCCQLDGIPLAIELAAARIGLLSVADIDRKLDQRFRLLTGGSRTALPRHHTLLSLIDWSYNLLNEPEKLLLQRLSAFTGGWTLDAAEAVCVGEGVSADDVFDLLTQLCDKSLVVVEQTERHSRFRLLESIRQYAREKLQRGAEGAAVRSRHSQYFLSLAESAERKLIAAAQSETLQQLTGEHENLLASLEWGIASRDATHSLRLCAALSEFWVMQGYLFEGRDCCERVLRQTEEQEPTPDRVKTLNAAGSLALYQGDFAAAGAWHHEALAVAERRGDQRGAMQAQGGLGLLALSAGDFAAAQAQGEASLKLAQTIGDRRGAAMACGNLGAISLSQGDYADARAMLNRSLSFAQETGDRWSAALILHRLGLVACFSGDCAAAERLLEESLGIRREFKDHGGIARALSGLGMVAHDQGQFSVAQERYRESLKMQRTLSDRSATAISLEGLAEAIAALGDVPRAARIWGATERLRSDIGAPLRPAWRRHCEQSVASARRALGDDDQFNQAWQQGRTLAFEQAIELALT